MTTSIRSKSQTNYEWEYGAIVKIKNYETLVKYFFIFLIFISCSRTDRPTDEVNYNLDVY